MPKKPTKKAEPTQEYDSQRETNILLEEMNKGIKSIAEGHAGLNQKIDKVSSELMYVKQAVFDVGDKVDKLEKKLDTVTTNHEDRIQKLEAVR